MKLIFLIFLVSSQTYADSSLKCSANGLNILYINGVNVDIDANNKSAKNVEKKISNIEESMDSNKIPIKKIAGVWNSSRKLSNDIEELKAQLASNHAEKDRFMYWQKIAGELIFNQTKSYDAESKQFVEDEKKKVSEALTQITSGTKMVYNSDGTINQDSFSQSDLYKDLIKYNVGLANLLANANSDVAVVEQLKIKIKEAYQMGDYKLIVIAHSQGNEVLYSAIKALRSDSTFLKTPSEIEKFDGLVGYMQVAPPSPELVTIGNTPSNYYQNHAQYIRHNRDGVIGLSEAMTGVRPLNANYVAEIGLPPDGFPNFFTGLAHYLENFFTTYVNGGIWTLYHGMDDSYLSNTYFATRNSTGVNKSLAEHFKDNMREIASKLQDNCDVPAIGLTSADGAFTDSSQSTFYMNGYSGASASVKFKASDLNDKDTIKTTQFSWTFSEFDSGSATPHNGYSASPSDTQTVGTPFNDVDVYVGVTATSKNGKSSSRGFVIKNMHNSKPSIVDFNATCKVGSDGTTSNFYEYSYRVDDDGTARLKEHSGAEPFFPLDGERSIKEADSSGLSDVFSYVNPCTDNFYTGSLTVRCQGSRPFLHVTAFSSYGYPEIYFTKNGAGAGLSVLKADIGGRVVDFSAAVDLPPGSKDILTYEAFVINTWNGEVHSAGTVEVKSCGL